MQIRDPLRVERVALNFSIPTTTDPRPRPKLVTELRELAVKGQAGDESITADAIREKIAETQQASLGLFQKVYEKRAAENSSSEKPAEENPEKKD